MALFPGALPAAGSASASDTLAAVGHTALHNTIADEARAIATKLGTGSSTANSGTVLRGTGAGASAWGQVALTTDITGVLPVANGGTGQSTQTGTGLPVAQTSPTINSPTITTPTIASFTNATHNHQNAAGGGTLSASAVPALDFSLQTISNPYKFSVYRNAAWTSANASFGKVQFDTKRFDTNSNFDNVTNFRYVAPVAGFYQFNARAGSSQTQDTLNEIAFYKNGVELTDGFVGNTGGAGTQTWMVSISDLIQLAAGDYIEVFFLASGGAGATGSVQSGFSGFLVSTT